MDKIETTPRLAICAPEKQTGKTRLLECLSLLCKDPLLAYNASPAAIVRTIEQHRPTLLLDEIDTIFGDGSHEDTRALINAGYRKSGTYLRCGGSDKVTPQLFAAYCAVATAGIGKPPETIYDRAVVINMRRKTNEEGVCSFRISFVKDYATELYERLEQWAEGVPEMTEDDAPEMPEGITDRQADIWEALLWIADMTYEWQSRANKACVAMTAAQEDDDSESSEYLRLLVDIRDIANEWTDNKISSQELVDELQKIDEAPWGTVQYGLLYLNVFKLVEMLKPYKIKSKRLYFGKDRKGNPIQRQGYQWKQFHDAWARYLPVED
jgi:hypothetical protein